MWKIYSFLFLLPLLLFSEELEVRLATQSRLKPLYLSLLYTDSSEYDWRYYEELRSALEFDLSNNGFCTLLPKRDDLEERLYWPNVNESFDLKYWKKEKIPYLIAIELKQNRIAATLFNIEKESFKRYSEISISGRTNEDRQAIHQLSDAITKDLFGVDGIASLKILYSQRTPKEDAWQSEIWICDSDGNGERQVSQDVGYAVCPGFFPKKAGQSDLEFYYVSYQQGQSKIYRSSLSQFEGKMMVSLSGSQALPALAKGGRQFAFIADTAGRPDLFLLSLDRSFNPTGKARQIYSQPRATQASPTFSPDGKQIAFVSDKDGPPRIYRMDVPSPQSTKRAKPELLTSKNRENTSPSWSPDGKKLAYSAKIEGVRQIWIYNFETKEERQLTTGPQNKENPSWAPNSLHLVYNTESDDTCELYLMHINDPSPVCISKGIGQKRFPCWEPAQH